MFALIFLLKQICFTQQIKYMWKNIILPNKCTSKDLFENIFFLVANGYNRIETKQTKQYKNCKIYSLQTPVQH